MKIVREQLNEIKIGNRDSGLSGLGIGNEHIRKQILQQIKIWKEGLSFFDKDAIFTLNDDLTIDIQGDFIVYDFAKDFTALPGFINFNIVSGDFIIKSANNTLETLKGCPKKVMGSFICDHNNLTSLEFAPEYVKNNFDCSYNKLTSLEHLPMGMASSTSYFNCIMNKLTSLKYGPREISGNYNCSYNYIDSFWCGLEKVSGEFNCSNNKLTSLQDCPKEVGKDFITHNNPVKFTHYMVKAAGCKVGGQVRFKDKN